MRTKKIYDLSMLTEKKRYTEKDSFFKLIKLEKKKEKKGKRESKCYK